MLCSYWNRQAQDFCVFDKVNKLIEIHDKRNLKNSSSSLGKFLSLIKPRHSMYRASIMEHFSPDISWLSTNLV